MGLFQAGWGVGVIWDDGDHIWIGCVQSKNTLLLLSFQPQYSFYRGHTQQKHRPPRLYLAVLGVREHVITGVSSGPHIGKAIPSSFLNDSFKLWVLFCRVGKTRGCFGSHKAEGAMLCQELKLGLE